MRKIFLCASIGISHLSSFGEAFAADAEAATAIEYGLIAGLIAVVIIGALSVLGTSISAKFQAVANNLS